ncbi:unnamed protein product [Cylicocyclus nassatus]|uniref:DUF148 domain-containing protein n=1 Tax=Cylicocyclus nassatus TaxID=53992 RepID=A0AA36GXT5_CYLNA|nr:unnamed protein product [Cylicocyclus nassatus]
MSPFSAYFTLIMIAFYGATKAQLEQPNKEAEVAPQTLPGVSLPVAPAQKIGASDQNGAGGFFTLQKLFEMFTNFSRGLLAPFQRSGDGSPLTLPGLPNLLDIFKLPGSFLGFRAQDTPRSRSEVGGKSIFAERLSTPRPFHGIDLPPPRAHVEASTLPDISTAPQAPDYCISKLKKQFKDNDTYFEDVKNQVQENKIAGAYEVVYAKAAEICTAEQVERLKALFNEYDIIQKDIEDLAPQYSKETKNQILQWLREDNFAKLSQFLVKEVMANKHKTRHSKLMEISSQLNSMQFDQIVNPI